MSKQIAELTEAKFEELAEATKFEVEDFTLTIEDGPMTSSIAGSDLITEGDDESEDTSEAGDESGDDDDIEDVEDTSEAGEVHLEEMEYNDLSALISEADVDYPEDSSKAGLLEAAEDIEDVSTVIGDDEDVTEGDEEEDTIEDGENEEDTISDSELVEAGVKESNIEDVRKYRSKNGVCSEGNCPYGANNGEDFCASHQGSSSSSKKKSSTSKKSNADKVSQVKDLFDLSSIEAEAVVFQVSEGNYDSHSEAVKNHL